jgi:aspartyl-tRNA(Asn)/glutamyl-tRNA(Gln) amidotransferase subunit B
MIDWEPVIGLELHVQLATKSKIFSGTSTAFGAPPNSQASAIDLGLPGVLPVLNERAVRMAVTFGLAIGARINERSHFDRKNYFYPDLPKGYQISQFQHPIVGEGLVTIALDDGTVRDVRITRAHLEEDAGKSIHDAYAGMTGVDLNRTGTPLLEVVSEPDLRSPEQASAYFRHMHALVRALRICDGDLSQGSMRCDANVSVRPRGATKLGVRTELKNINSFRFVEIAVRGEIERQIALLERGGTVARETRGFDATTDGSRRTIPLSLT